MVLEYIYLRQISGSVSVIMFEEFQSVIFSDLLEHNSDVLTKFSPRGEAFAAANQSQLLVWDIHSKILIHKFISEHPIESMEWSPDSELIYCCMCKNTIFQIWNLLMPEWRWKVVDNSLAFIDILWAPDSRHLLVISEFYIKMKVWSLVSRTTAVLENTKPVKNCTSFSSCGRYLGVAERIAFEDYVAIYTSETWEMLKSFPVETKDTIGIHFSPSDLVIAVLEATTEEYKVLFYSVDGRLLAKYDKTSNLGITSLSWSPNGKFIVLSGFSGEVTILQCSTYKEIACFEHPETVESQNIVVYKVTERSSELNYQVPMIAFSNWQLYKVERERPVSLSSLPNLTEKSKSKSVKAGIQNLQYSADGHYIATIYGHQSNILCIFDTQKLKLSNIIAHCYKIKSISWHPKKPLLAICTGSSTLDIWTPSCCICVFTPFKDDFAINGAEWCPSKDCLILNGKEKFAFLNLH